MRDSTAENGPRHFSRATEVEDGVRKEKNNAASSKPLHAQRREKMRTVRSGEGE